MAVKQAGGSLMKDLFMDSYDPALVHPQMEAHLDKQQRLFEAKRG